MINAIKINKSGIKFKIVFLTVIFCSLILYYFIHNGFYPIAIINSKLVSAQLFKKECQTALIYYQNALKTYYNQNLNFEDKDLFIELRRAALDKLIENSLIYSEVKKRAGRELLTIVDKKMPQFQESVTLLYGLNIEEFKELVLKPQIYKEILEGRLLLENEDFNYWLEQTKKSAKVTLLLSEFTWNGSKVEIKK